MGPGVGFGGKDPESAFQCAGEKPNPSVQRQTHEDEEHSSVACQAKLGNCHEPWLQEASTAQEADRAGKASVSTHIVKTKTAVHRTNHYGQLSKVKTMFDQALMKSEKKRDSLAA